MNPKYLPNRKAFTCFSVRPQAAANQGKRTAVKMVYFDVEATYPSLILTPTLFNLLVAAVTAVIVGRSRKEMSRKSPRVLCRHRKFQEY